MTTRPSASEAAGLPRRALRLAPVLLLILVGLSQHLIVHLGGLLTPAKGGGFGMFSTFDKLNNRHFYAYILHDGVQSRLVLQGSDPIAEELKAAKALPTDRRLRSVAQKLVDEIDEMPIDGVRVEVWKRTFDTGTGWVRRVKVREVTVRKRW